MTKVVLLVEDNESDEKLTLRALKKGNLANEVVVARTGLEALDWLFGTGTHAGRDLSVQPAVVLLDLKLPGVEGLEVLRRIRADPLTKLLPVVILTSSKQDEDVAGGYALGANAYVRKPVDFTAFIEAARVVGLFWLLHNEAAPIGRQR